MFAKTLFAQGTSENRIATKDFYEWIFSVRGKLENATYSEEQFFLARNLILSETAKYNRKRGETNLRTPAVRLGDALAYRLHQHFLLKDFPSWTTSTRGQRFRWLDKLCFEYWRQYPPQRAPERRRTEIIRLADHRR